jgi:acyl transferase domain-containing protein
VRAELLFMLKRLADAERDGDRIYAVLMGIAGSSDGKGKGITAPNPIGQRLAVERAWAAAGVDPATATMIEAHGTSTRVGDVSEARGTERSLRRRSAKPGSIALGSVKSNIGHLKAAAGAAGTVQGRTKSLSEQVLAPSLHFQTPNPNIDWANTRRSESQYRTAGVGSSGECGVRTAGVSAFGFGGSNFHAVARGVRPRPAS